MSYDTNPKLQLRFILIGFCETNYEKIVRNYLIVLLMIIFATNKNMAYTDIYIWMEIQFETIFQGAVFLLSNGYATSPTCKALVETSKKTSNRKKKTTVS